MEPDNNPHYTENTAVMKKPPHKKVRHLRQYQDLLNHVLHKGTTKTDRIGTGTLAVFSHHMQFDLANGFPLVTTKKLHLKSIIHKLIWFLRGDTNIRCLQDNGVSVWNEWVDANGDLEPLHGRQWRSCDGAVVDQIAWVTNEIRTNPDSRRLIVPTWNPADIPKKSLLPSHCLFEFFVADGRLSCLRQAGQQQPPRHSTTQPLF